MYLPFFTRVVAAALLCLAAGIAAAQQYCPDGKCPLVPQQPQPWYTPRPAAGPWAEFVPVIREICQGGVNGYSSGVLVHRTDAYGYVLTNAHCVRDGYAFEVIWPDETHKAELLKVDQAADLALLRINRPRARAIELAETAPSPGDQVMVVGHGYQSFRARLFRFLRLDSGILHIHGGARQGDSGGGIFNTRGRLCGILHSTSGDRQYGASLRAVRGFVAFVFKGRPTPAQPPAQPPALVPIDPEPGCECDLQPILARLEAVEKRAVPLPVPMQPQLTELTEIVARLEKIEPQILARLEALEKRPVGADHTTELAALRQQIENLASRPQDVTQQIEAYVRQNPITVRTFDHRGREFDEPYKVHLGEDLPLRTVITNEGQ